MGVILMSLRTPRSAREIIWSTWECRWQAWERWQQAWERRQQAWERWRQVWELQRKVWECQRHVWEHHESQYSGLGNTSLGTLLVCLEIIDTTYRSMIVKAHVLRLYFHLCIYPSMYLCIYIATHLNKIYMDWLQAGLKSNSSCAWKWQSSEPRDTLWGRDRASLEIHLDAVVEHIWRYTLRPGSSEHRDALRDHDRMSLEMHMEAMIVRTWRS